MPAFPRTSSATSGLSFCGIIDEPVADVLGERGEAELGRRPEDELLADPREMDEADRGGVEVVEREVAVGDGVERVAQLPLGRRAAASVEPASAPAPSGLAGAASAAAAKRPRSRSSISTQASR